MQNRNTSIPKNQVDRAVKGVKVYVRSKFMDLDLIGKLVAKRPRMKDQREIQLSLPCYIEMNASYCIA